MKKINADFRGAQGSLPPQLFKYVDQTQMAAETARFTEYINSVSGDFLDKLAERKRKSITVGDSDFATIVPQTPKLFGQDVSLEYIGCGMAGNVYKMQIGDNTFALKINRRENLTTDLEAIAEHRRARNLINRPYIGATFSHDGATYSWILSDYISDDQDNDMSFVSAKAKLFYAAMTKGLKYSDMYPANVKAGRIIDISGVERGGIKLRRIEIDMVKKFLYLMRTNDVPRFRQLAEIAVASFPNVIKYIFTKMNIYRMEIPMQLQPFKKMLVDYNRRVRAIYNGVYDTPSRLGQGK